VPDAGRPEFTFSLALSHDPRFDRMLADLTSAVLRHVGYPPEAVTELIGVLQNAMAGKLAAGGRECQVAFRAQDGQLRIGLTFDGGAQWCTVRPLPRSD
jgi:hypothetical protein